MQRTKTFCNSDELSAALHSANVHIHDTRLGNLETLTDMPDLIKQITMRTDTAFSSPPAHVIAKYLSEKFRLGEHLHARIEQSLHEAITNAIIHGNLEIGSMSEAYDHSDDYYEAIQHALKQRSRVQRRITIDIQKHEATLTLSVTDEGNGYKETNQGNHTPLTGLSGRGLTIIASACSSYHVTNHGRSIAMAYEINPATQRLSAKSGSNLPKLIDSSLRFLIVDDVESNRFILRTMLENGGYQHFREAANGKQALDIVADYSPDVVLTDIMMPIMDGYTLCRHLRSQTNQEHLVIIAVTSIDNPKQRFEIFQHGASDLISTPYNQFEVLARIHSQVERNRIITELRNYKESMQRELKTARSMQIALMPSTVQLAPYEDSHHVRISSHAVPSMEVGGDIWGVLPIDSHMFGIYLCDICGHGVGAALNSFRIHTLINENINLAAQPGELMSVLNKRLHILMDTEQYATFFYAVVDVTHRVLRYAAAASPPPVLHSPTRGTMEYIDSSGLPLGILADARYEEQTIAFEPTDNLLLYSDALLETECPGDGVCLSEDGLKRLLHAATEKDGCWNHKKLIESIVIRLNVTQQGLNDDLSIVAVSYLP